MGDYDIKLQKLLEKYNLNKKITNKNAFIEHLENIINDFKFRKNRDPNIIVWGGGDHAKHLLELEIIKNFKIKYIVDKNEKLHGRKIKNISIISFNELRNIDFDMFIIASLEYKDEIKSKIKTLFPTKCYIDMYEFKYINERKTAFFAYDYYSLETIIKQYEKNKSKENLRKLIIELLYIRDFISAKIYIYEYIQQKYPYSAEFLNFLKEFDMLMEKFKKELQEKSQNNNSALGTVLVALNKFKDDLGCKKNRPQCILQRII